MELPVPRANQDAYNREKYDLENYKKPGLLARSTDWLHGGPDVSHAAKSGPPTMTDPKPTIPVSIPVVNTVQASDGAGAASGTTDVTATPIKDSGALDKQTDARSSGGAAQTAATDQPQQQGPLPTNRDKDLKKLREQQAKRQAKLDKKNKKKEQNGTSAQQNQSNANQGAQTPTGTPAATSTQPTTKPPSGQNPQPNQ
jgi:hypothetical protein